MCEIVVVVVAAAVAVAAAAVAVAAAAVAVVAAAVAVVAAAAAAVFAAALSIVCSCSNAYSSIYRRESHLQPRGRGWAGRARGRRKLNEKSTSSSLSRHAGPRRSPVLHVAERAFSHHSYIHVT